MPFLASEGCFWPLTASMTLEVKNNHAHVTTQRILNKFFYFNEFVANVLRDVIGIVIFDLRGHGGC